MTKVCANLLGSISRSLQQNAEWQMEMLDETRKPFSGFAWSPNPSADLQQVATADS